MCKYGEWDKYYLTCGAEINGICTPTPFNYKTIDDFYSKEDAAKIKSEIERAFPGKSTATVVETLNSESKEVARYAQFLFDNDYSLYSAKQWGVSPSEIDPSILRRVPLRFNYNEGYFNDEYQYMPHNKFSDFFERLLNHRNIEINLNVDAMQHIKICGNKLEFDEKVVNFPVIYTGALDELFDCCFGKLPYRSLRFEWRHDDKVSFQKYPVVAYPQAPDFVRIIEYNKLPIQQTCGTTYEVEYSIPYQNGENIEPYYPLLTEESKKKYIRYAEKAAQIKDLYVCGRLGDFKYYNMDQALEKALAIAGKIS
jgi:UDP-galactopyranose mutase